MNRSYFPLLVVVMIFASCGKKASTTSSTASDTCNVPQPDVPAAAGQLVFTLPADIDRCNVGGYIVGFKDQLKVSAASDGKYYITNVPAGEQDVIITAGSLSIGLLADKAKDRGVRLKKQKFLNGVKNEPGEIAVPKFGSLTGVAKLIGQTDHAGIDVYIPGTDMIAKTDVDGKFSISNVPVGEHNLFFEKDGYHRGRIESIEVTTEKTTDLSETYLAVSTGAEGFVLIDFGNPGAISRKVALVIGATSNAVLMKISEDISFTNLSWKPVASASSYTFSSDGIKTLYVKFADANGLESSPFSTSIDIRQTAVLRPARDYLASASAGNILLFGGGGQPADGGSRAEVDIYNFSKSYWTSTTLSTARYSLAATSLGDKAFFAGGGSGSGYSNVIDIFDANSGNWSVAALSQARSNMAAVSAGAKALFGGGNASGGVSGIVDIYSAATNSWSTSSLSVARSGLVASGVQNKVIFAGGNDGTNYSSVVDIFDCLTNGWTTTNLSQARDGLASATLGSKSFFAGGTGPGGNRSNVVDIYDSELNSWSTASLSQARTSLAGTSVGTKVIFAGGVITDSSNPSAVADIYDTVTNSWSTASLSQARAGLTAISNGTKAIFAGGNSAQGRSSVIDIYDSATNTWSTEFK